MNKPYHIHSTEVKSGKIKNKLLMHTATWMNVRTTTWKEGRQTPHSTNCDSIYVKFRNKQNESVVMDVRSVVACRDEAGEVDCKKAEESFWGDGNSLYLDLGKITLSKSNELFT